MPPRLSITPPHLLLAVAVVAIWGTNFVVMKLAFGHFPPLLFAALRFLFVLVPALLLVPRPAMSWSRLAAYGLGIGVMQFGLIYVAVDGFISPGLASLVVQMQVFFTIFLSLRLFGERVRSFQLVALTLAAAGLAVLFMHTDGETTTLGVVLVLFAGLGWSLGNIALKGAGKVDVLGCVVWSCVFAVPPLLALSLVFEGAETIRTSIANAPIGAWLAVLWQSAANTLFGYAAWGWLLARYPAAVITPTALLVPIFGMGASALWLGEALPAWKLLAAALVMGGLALNLIWPRLRGTRDA